MENQYYIPETEDLYVGYLCEIYEQSTIKLVKRVNWHSVKIVLGNSEYGESVSINRIPKYIRNNHLRVSYLTQEQLIAEGWEFTGRAVRKWFKKEVYGFFPIGSGKYSELKLQLDEKYKGIHIEAFFGGESEGVLFEGLCPSVNELRFIMKLLKIK